MNSAKERVERRIHKRFQVDNSALVLLGWYYEEVGRIMDISMGGVAFRYTPHGEEQNESDVTIVLSETNFYLHDLPAKTISDFELVGKTPTTSTTERRRGVQFVRPTDHQKSQIEFFINNYSIRETGPPEVNPYIVLEELAKVRDGFRS